MKVTKTMINEVRSKARKQGWTAEVTGGNRVTDYRHTADG